MVINALEVYHEGPTLDWVGGSQEAKVGFPGQ